ncbi:hypothetical protein SEUCBS139899_009104 [Sporothrix eucalyptigena]
MWELFQIPRAPSLALSAGRVRRRQWCACLPAQRARPAQVDAAGGECGFDARGPFLGRLAAKLEPTYTDDGDDEEDQRATGGLTTWVLKYTFEQLVTPISGSDSDGC